jgi:nickel transport protein
MRLAAKERDVIWKSPWSICMVVTMWFLFFMIPPSWAHKVTIFAWVEGDTVHTQSKFSGGKKAKNAAVVVFDMEGNQLLEGKTDENGAFSFPVPKKTGLRVVLKASMGHQNEWIIPAEEFKVGDENTAADPTPDSSEIRTETGASEPTIAASDDPVHREQARGASSECCLSRKELSTLVEDAVDKKLTPVMHLLAETQQSGPTLEKILGGIGYIFGIVGVAFYFAGRGKKSRSKG